MPLCHAGLHLLYPQRVNMFSATEYNEDVQVMSRKPPPKDLNLSYFWICLALWQNNIIYANFIVLFECLNALGTGWWSSISWCCLIPLVLHWFVNFEAMLMPQALCYVLQAAPEWYLWRLRQHACWGGMSITSRRELIWIVMWLLIRRLYCLNPNFSVPSSYVNDSASQEPKPTFLVGQQEALLELSQIQIQIWSRVSDPECSFWCCLHVFYFLFCCDGDLKLLQPTLF